MLQTSAAALHNVYGECTVCMQSRQCCRQVLQQYRMCMSSPFKFALLLQTVLCVYVYMLAHVLVIYIYIYMCTYVNIYVYNYKYAYAKQLPCEWQCLQGTLQVLCNARLQGLSQGLQISTFNRSAACLQATMLDTAKFCSMRNSASNIPKLCSMLQQSYAPQE
jgi:hypothetical protein